MSIQSMEKLAPLDRLRVKQARIARGWSQQDLAVAAGVHTSSVQRVEGGASRYPSADLRKRLTRALGLPEDGLDQEAAVA